MMAVLMLLLALCCSVLSRPVVEPLQRAAANIQQGAQSDKPFFHSLESPQPKIQKAVLQKMNRERRRRLGHPIHEKLPEEAKMRSMPQYMRGMTMYEKRKERKRMLGLRPKEDVPEMYTRIPNEVLVRAEQMRKQDTTLSIPASIQVAQHYFDAEKMVFWKDGHEEEAGLAATTSGETSNANAWKPARKASGHLSVTSEPIFKLQLPVLPYHSPSGKQIGRIGTSLPFDLNLPPPIEEE
jgi:hypothetical protein